MDWNFTLLIFLLYNFFRSAASLESNGSGPHASNTSIASSGFIFSYKAEVQHQFNFYESSVRTDEVKLKDFVTQLKNARSSIQSTIATDLESMHAEDGGPEKTNVSENRTADLEMAVLVQVRHAKRVNCRNWRNRLSFFKYFNITNYKEIFKLSGVDGHAGRESRFEG